MVRRIGIVRLDVTRFINLDADLTGRKHIEDIVAVVIRRGTAVPGAAVVGGGAYVGLRQRIEGGIGHGAAEAATRFQHEVDAGGVGGCGDLYRNCPVLRVGIRIEFLDRPRAFDFNDIRTAGQVVEGVGARFVVDDITTAAADVVAGLGIVDAQVALIIDRGNATAGDGTGDAGTWPQGEVDIWRVVGCCYDDRICKVVERCIRVEFIFLAGGKGFHTIRAARQPAEGVGRIHRINAPATVAVGSVVQFDADLGISHQRYAICGGDDTADAAAQIQREVDAGGIGGRVDDDRGRTVQVV